MAKVINFPKKEDHTIKDYQEYIEKLNQYVDMLNTVAKDEVNGDKARLAAIDFKDQVYLKYRNLLTLIMSTKCANVSGANRLFEAMMIDFENLLNSVITEEEIKTLTLEEISDKMI